MYRLRVLLYVYIYIDVCMPYERTRFDLSQRLIAVITILKYISNTLSIVRVHVLS